MLLPVSHQQHAGTWLASRACTCEDSIPLQGRALTTYIRRSYFPFLAKEPTLQPGGGGSRHALFTYTKAHEGARGRGNGSGSGATGQAQLRLGAALLVPSLADVPAALTSLTAAIQQSGADQTYLFGFLSELVIGFSLKQLTCLMSRVDNQ